MWERGDREPSLTNLKKIALALGASLDELVLGNRSRENPELNTGNKSALGVIASPDSWQWESDSSHRVTKAVMKTNIVGKRRRDYGINPSIPWRVVDVIMDNHQPIVDLKFQYILNGRLIAVSVSGEPVYGSRNEFVGYRGTGHEIKGMELDAYLRGIPKKN